MLRRLWLFSIFCLLAAILYLNGHLMSSHEVSDRPAVETTLFPVYDFARTVAGKHWMVDMVIPPGAEVHSFSLSPRGMRKILNADIFLYCGNGIEPWAEKMVTQKDGNSKRLNVDVTHGIGLTGLAHACTDCDADHGETEAGIDPHIWTDPILAVGMVRRIADAFCRADSLREAEYRDRADGLMKEIFDLDSAFRDFSVRHPGLTIVYCGHSAFEHFAGRYGFKMVRAYPGSSSNEQVSPKQLSNLIQTVKDKGIKVIYCEENSVPRLARIVSEETGAKILLLHGVHNVSPTEFQTGASWVTLMRQNLENLKKGVGE